MSDRWKAVWKSVSDFLDDAEDPNEPQYDPVHVGLAIMLVLLGLAVLFWLFWTLLVYEGGLFAKIGPGLRVLFTSQTAKDFGYEGYPYEMGVFEGWVGNVAALGFLILILAGVAWLFRSTSPREKE